MAAKSSKQPHQEERAQGLPSEHSARERIIAAARPRFFAYGFRSVTMDDIAAELGMSKKTLYTHFSRKSALVEAVMLDKFRRVEADLEQITSECASDFLAALQQLLACMQRHLEEAQPPFVRDVRRDAPEIFQLVVRHRRDLIDRYFAKLLAEGQTAGIFRKDLSAKLVTEILLAAVQGIINPDKMAELNLTPKVGFSTIITVILEGVMTETARAKR